MLLNRRFVPALVGAVLPLALAPGLVLPARAAGDPSAPPADSSPRALRVLAQAEATLQQALPSSLRGSGGARTEAHDATLALLALRHALPQLDRRDRTRARALFARPDGTNGTRYDLSSTRWTTTDTAAAKSTCDDPTTYGVHPFCVHWVPEGTTTGGLLPSPSRQVATDDAVAETVRAMSHVWSTEIGTLGYRAPRGDGATGSEQVPTADKLDVYLADSGASRGGAVYGYAVPEAFTGQTSPGYLVLDNDFSSAQFGTATTPDAARDVTAAHEFFHLVQFAYDTGESSWLMESTATWMEERAYSAVNDNRQYIASSSLHWPGQPVDTFVAGDVPQYGTWVFHELLSEHLGNAVIRRVWGRAAAVPGNNARSALSSALRSEGSSLLAEFRRFSGGSIAPARFWHEGGAWPRAVISRTWTLSRASRSTGLHATTLDHLASVDVVMQPKSTLTADWKLRIHIDGPSSGGTAYILVFFRDGSARKLPLGLDGSGNRTYSVPFSASKVSRVALALGNASATDGRTTAFRATIWR
ncbi:hypothetical protein GCM10011584_06040 [Nocardioides phosphati]|uniref:Uncharacterized protein n=1 Tax=Nocardioides phosphati TaxID=1867775 RepID=A0ABQ2N5U5_9ACTN|nr:MXAN_6640 family putative metalloprotease [Nocardioides phosphati]GGO85631.1 hypothetical protein GCM10011584_06040 [Nocardioides phosphati]